MRTLEKNWTHLTLGHLTPVLIFILLFCTRWRPLKYLGLQCSYTSTGSMFQFNSTYLFRDCYVPRMLLMDMDIIIIMLWSLQLIPYSLLEMTAPGSPLWYNVVITVNKAIITEEDSSYGISLGISRCGFKTSICRGELRQGMMDSLCCIFIYSAGEVMPTSEIWEDTSIINRYIDGYIDQLLDR